ncbi:MAG: M56 family metallopeptidase [Persicimonas sp.]
MEVWMGWLQLALVIVVAGMLGGALASALASGRWMDRLKTVAPRPRFVLLGALVLLPVATAVVAVAVAFAPSTLDALGLVRDHCAHHGGHAFHLCFVHGHPPELSPLVLGGAIAMFIWLAAVWSDEFGRLRQVRDWSRRLGPLARFDAEIDCWTLATDRPLAVTVGLVDPKVYVSGAMREFLSEPQLRAVVAHEEAHARRFDSLVKFLLGLCAPFHLPPVRERLVEELDLACEQACDEAAAEAVGDRLAVAEALLAVERAYASDGAGGSDEVPSSALSFGTGALDRRVRGMLDEGWSSPNWLLIGGSAVVALSAIGVSYEVLHHTAETLLSKLF